MIATQVLMLTLGLTVGWGVYFFACVAEYLDIRERHDRRQAEVLRGFRRVVVSFCLWLLPLSFFFRTGLVLLGVGDGVAGQVVFFALASTNVVGCLFCLASLRHD